ncbi:MAG: nucleotide exchange factor GrpE [Acidimicrobiales bacterium]|jgi:molecular chaperone GrpE
MTDIYGSDRDAGEQEPEVDVISGSRFDRGADLDDKGIADADVVDAEVIGGELDDDTTEIISGAAPEFADLKEALAERDEYLDSLRRLQAEFENYKKRVAKQQSDQVARAALSLVDKLLPVLDTLDLATSHIGNAESADGRALVAASGQLRDVLAKEGLERIDPLGEEFDPTAHEAVGQVAPGAGWDDAAGSAGSEEAATAASPGEPVVAEVMRPGYRWRGAVVRPAMVMVQG